METTIALPDDLVSTADAFADRLGVSRSELFATALAEFLAKHAGDKITARLDEIYATEPSALAPDIRRAQHRLLTAMPPMGC